jgi:hypothetical protein
MIGSRQATVEIIEAREEIGVVGERAFGWIVVHAI